MYYDYFGLKQPPFKITPDTRLFFPGCNRGAVLDALIYAILSGEGIVKVVGEVGSGKTMLCRMLEKELPQNVEIVYLANPSLSPENILHAIAFELKLPVGSDASRLQVMNKLHEYLLQRHSQNRQVVVFVEEAQGMPLATLEEIRLLSNLETQQSKLLQIVLFGQPELDQMIARPEIRQLKERITYSFQLMPFAINDIREYLNSRLRACGYRAGELFDVKATKEIERFSKGLVRRINILADKSLLAAYAENSHIVNKRHVRTAARDSEFISRARYKKFYPLWLASGLVLAVIVISVLVARSSVTVPRPETAAEVVEDKNSNEEIVPKEEYESTANPAGEIKHAAEELPVVQEAESIKKEENIEVEIETSAESGAAVVTQPAGGHEENLGQEAEAPEPDRFDLKEIIARQKQGVETNLTENELDAFQRQLEALPPEAPLLYESSPSGDNCRVCWAMLYRPLQVPESL